MLRFRGSGDVNEAVRARLDQLARLEGAAGLAGRRFVDIPAGRGRMSAVARDHGAIVEPYDLAPEAFEAPGLRCRPADLQGTLPIPDSHADWVLFQEAIEHLPDPLHALRELNRILVPGGRLLLTTPNVSNLRARVSRLLVESDLYNRLPPGESDVIWEWRQGRPYFGHLFLIGVQRLRTLLGVAGFRLTHVHPVKVSRGSLLFAWLSPVIAGAGLYAYWRTGERQRRDGIFGTAVRREMLRLNLHPTVLFGKHLFLEWTKEREPVAGDVRTYKDPTTVR